MNKNKNIRSAGCDVYDNTYYDELEGFDLLEESEEAEAEDKDIVKSIGEENKNSSSKDIKSSCTLVEKNASTQEVLSYPAANQEIKKSRVVTDKSGNTRRPVNMTLCDDVSEALNILAIKRRVRPWHILNEALRRYLREEGVDGF